MPEPFREKIHKGADLGRQEAAWLIDGPDGGVGDQRVVGQDLDEAAFAEHVLDVPDGLDGDAKTDQSGLAQEVAAIGMEVAFDLYPFGLIAIVKFPKG